jgi:hypothetical protein
MASPNSQDLVVVDKSNIGKMCYTFLPLDMGNGRWSGLGPAARWVNDDED